jgi:hypothetical protein
MKKHNIFKQALASSPEECERPTGGELLSLHDMHLM